MYNPETFGLWQILRVYYRDKEDYNRNDKIVVKGLENGLYILSSADDSKSFNHNNIN